MDIATLIEIVLGILALFATLGGIFAAYHVFFMEKSKRALSYYLTITSLLDINETIKNDIQISYKGNLIQNLQLLRFRIINNGNTTITEHQYSDPITVKFPDDISVLEATVIETNPADILKQHSNLLKPIENGFLLIPILLNSKDSLVIRVLATIPQGKIENSMVEVLARIEGIKDVKRLVEGGEITEHTPNTTTLLDTSTPSAAIVSMFMATLVFIFLIVYAYLVLK